MEFSTCSEVGEGALYCELHDPKQACNFLADDPNHCPVQRTDVPCACGLSAEFLSC